MRIELTIDPAVRQRIDVAWIADQCTNAARLIARPITAIDVLIVDDRRMTTLHERHLSDPTTTDVLTFHMGEGNDGVEVQLVICADAAARHAESRGHSIDREILLYALHGLLHCAGFDDATEEASRAMHAEEDRILTAIGVGEVFAGLRGASDEPRQRSV